MQKLLNVKLQSANCILSEADHLETGFGRSRTYVMIHISAIFNISLCRKIIIN